MILSCSFQLEILVKFNKKKQNIDFSYKIKLIFASREKSSG